MTGEWYLLGRGKVAHTEICDIRSTDKSSFGQVHLARDRLHGRLIHIVRVEQDGAWIAAQGLVCEGVYLHEWINWHFSSPD
jgi:hypothetical protein